MSLYSSHNRSSRLFPKHLVSWSPDLCSIVKHSRSATVISNSGWKEATVTHNSWLSDRSLDRKTHYYRYMLFPGKKDLLIHFLCSTIISACRNMLHYNFLYVTVHLNVLFVFPVSSFPLFFHVLHLWIKDALTPPTHPLLPLFYSLPLYHFHFVVSLWPGVLCICLMHHWLSVCFVFVRAAGMSCCMRVSWLIDSSIPVSCFISQGGRCCSRKKLLWQGGGGHSPSSCLLVNGWHWLRKTKECWVKELGIIDE